MRKISRRVTAADLKMADADQDGAVEESEFVLYKLMWVPKFVPAILLSPPPIFEPAFYLIYFFEEKPEKSMRT